MDMEIDLAAEKRNGTTDTNTLTLHRSEKRNYVTGET